MSCTDCRLHVARKNIVFGHGPTTAKIMLVGEAPGELEDEGGVPFVGPAGDKLDRIFNFVGIAREEVFITNTVMCRPPNNRVPLLDERLACKPKLLKYIIGIKPKLVIALGKTALEQILDTVIKEPLKNYITKDIIRSHAIENHTFDLVITYHPSYLLRNPNRGYKESLPQWEKVKQWIKSH